MWTRDTAARSLREQSAIDQASIEAAMLDWPLPDGSRTPILDIGAGTAIVFVPMVPELNFVYAPQLADLQRDYRALVYAPRLSRCTRVTVADRAREIEAVLDSRGIDRAHVVAWSDAGAAAYAFAKMYPARCRSVVFLGLADRYVFPLPLRIGMRILDRTSIDRALPAWLLAGILALFLGGPQVKRAWFRARARRIPRLPSLFKHSVLPLLLEHAPVAGEVTVPCVVLCGDQDALVSVEQARRMAALLPAADAAVIIQGGEHFLGYVHAQDVNREIRRFFSVLPL